MDDQPTVRFRSHWPHAPEHRLSQAGTYLVTAGTHQRECFFCGSERLDALHGGLLKYANKYRWRLEAWAVFPNHYHFVGHSPFAESSDEEGKSSNQKAEISAESLRVFLADFHQNSASWINRLDETIDRKVWHNYFETRLDFERSYLARLNYVHQNAVKHGLVRTANEYRWCSAAWFERTATAAQVKTIYGFKTDRVNVHDDY